MILALVKELENVGFSTEKAFQSIFKVYWEQDPKNSDWKNKFEEVFTIDVDTFYESLSNYSTDMSVIYPSSSITVQNIINDNTDIAQVNTETTSTETTSTETTSTETTSSTYNITVTAQNSSDYTLSGSDQNGNVSGNDPSISAKVGDTLSFNVNSPGHDFFIIINSNGGFISTNLPSGVSNNGTANGTVTWTPSEAGTYYYICEFHPAMIGTITITQ